mmetsp:Transcript_26991/g.35207  ORF Transcript_26991/g.35207 Transcript_26991/m.35207 type:complete len:101 (-) Transcript_26991:494-796(-)
MSTIITGLGCACLAIIMTYLFAKKELQKELDREKAQIEAEELNQISPQSQQQQQRTANGYDNDVEGGMHDKHADRRISGERIRWDYDGSKEDGEWFWVWA